MDDLRVGTALRVIRVRKRLRQKDVAALARLSPTIVARIEHGRLANVSLGSIRRVAQALDARVDTFVRWRGGDLGRLINARHTAMHEVLAQTFAALEVIDILAWHPKARTLLVIELKTELVDVNELMGSVDRKGRLAAEIARKRGWRPASISTWVVLADGRTNRRALANHETVLRAKFPDDGRRVRGWLHQPGEAIHALSFLPSTQTVTLGRDLRPIRRVTRPRSITPRA